MQTLTIVTAAGLTGGCLIAAGAICKDQPLIVVGAILFAFAVAATIGGAL